MRKYFSIMLLVFFMNNLFADCRYIINPSAENSSITLEHDHTISPYKHDHGKL